MKEWLLKSCKDFSFWLLLALRSALKLIPIKFTFYLFNIISSLLTRRGVLYCVVYPFCTISIICFSAIHFRSKIIRKVSCYTLLRRFRLPWPLSFCLNYFTSFVVSINKYFGILFVRSVHPALPILLTKTGPLSNSHNFKQ